MQNKGDIVIVGSGVAGCSLAIKLAQLVPESNIIVLTKSELEESNSFYAQGGIAAVTDFTNDSFELHIKDTLASGGGLSDPAIVKIVIENAPERIKELADYGTNFTLKEDGTYDLALEGGHSRSRVVHAFDHTGKYVMQALLKKAKAYPNIHFYENRLGIEIIKNEEKKATGISVINLETNEVEHFFSRYIVLATGGSGQVYKNTTNPVVATGDGVAMGMKIGAKVSNLNYIQFHPTAFYQEGQKQLYLLTEAIRGYGAYVVNHRGERFLFDYDERGELATRDIVSSAIFSELKKSGKENVFLDCRHLEKTGFIEKFPEITEHLEKCGYFIEKDLIPIVPATHYQCGGLKVDVNGKTNIEGLFAIGECSDTGLHGVNRLASNSLLEGLVFGNEIAEYIAPRLLDLNSEIGEISPYHYIVDIENEAKYLEIIDKIKSVMTKYATIVSTKEDLEIAEHKLFEIEKKLAKLQKPSVISENSLIAENLFRIADEITRSKLENMPKN